MSNTIDRPIWEVVSSVNYQIQQEETSQKRGQARIAEAHHLQGKQKVAKDVMLPSAGDNQEGKINKGKGVEAKPKLPHPTKEFSGLKEDDGDEGGKTLGLIAIIGEVMALQAKSNSNFWSTLWRQASQSMMMEVKFAPIIAGAIKAAYNAQSAATQAQADQSREDGIINLAMFGGGVLLAGAATVSEGAGAAEDAPAEQKPSSATSEVDEGKAEEEDAATVVSDDDAAAAASRDASQDTENATQEENATANNNRAADEAANSPEAAERPKRTAKIIQEAAGRATKRLSGFLTKGMQAMTMMEMLSKGVTGIWVDAKYQSKQAAEQGREGQAQALSKESEQYAQFYGQAFSRSEDLRQGCQQNIDYAMNILKSAADTITQTVTSMFRG